MIGLSKLFFTVLLLAAGFFGASMFGPPELTERLMGQWATPPMPQGEGLRPLSQRLAAPVQAAPRFSPAQLPASSPNVSGPALPGMPTSAPASAWQTPDFAAKPTAAVKPVAMQQGPLEGPSADFNAWLGAAGNWLDRENATTPMPPSTKYQQDEAVAPVAGFGEPTSPRAAVAWLPPRDAVAPQVNGPSLFTSNGNEQTVQQEQAVGDAWGEWNVAQVSPATSARFPPAQSFPASLGPSPHDASRRTYEAGYAPVARSPKQTNYGTHVVTDGDTLPDLAKRYLGDAARAEELYQLNRDRLDHPDLLPIGLVLRMPDEPRQPAAPPAGDWSQQRPVRNGPFSTVSSGDDTRDEPSRMVPIGDPTEKPAHLPNAMYADEWSW